MADITLQTWQLVVAIVAIVAGVAAALVPWFAAHLVKLGAIEGAVKSLPAIARRLVDHERRIARIEGARSDRGNPDADLDALADGLAEFDPDPRNDA